MDMANGGQRFDGEDAAHTSGITTALMLGHVENCGGREAVKAVLARIGKPDREAALRDERTWWSWDTKVAIFEAAAEVLGDPEVTYNAGRASLEMNVAAPLKAALRALGSPSLVYTNIVRANHKFSTASRMVLDEIGGHRARIRYEHLIELESHPLDCLYNQGLLSCVPVLFDLPPARIEHPTCGCRTGGDCVYEVTWQPQSRPSWRRMLGSGSAAVGLVAGAGLLLPEAGVAAVAGLGGAGLAWHATRRRQDLVQAVGRLERELDMRTERSERIRASLHALSSALNHDEVVARITEYSAQALGGHDTVLLLEENGAWVAQPSPTVSRVHAPDLERWAATDPPELNGTISIDDLTTEPLLAGLPARRPAAAALCASPLTAHGQRLGLLVALAQRPFSFLPQDLATLQLFAEQASIALFNAKLYATQQEMATRDPLTGLRNHREFHETVEQELARCRRSAARFSLALLDLDGFKGVNDTAGHAAGDRLLHELGAALESATRAGDIAFRVGGDEFAVLLPESTGGEAEAAVQRIVDAASEVDHRIGVSWGIATWPADGREKGEVIARADERLYEMKRTRGTRTALKPEEAFLAAIAALVEALEHKDAYTAAHAHGVADLARTVGIRMGLGEDALRTLAHAALLHDIGKIAIPTEILVKPEKLTDDEFEVIRSHAAVGAGMVARIPGLEPVAPLVRHAHERWDGDGYPDRIAGEEIPLGARIIAVCDAFHAMTSDRPYRAALPLEAALAELERHAGTQFDAAVVAALLRELAGTPA
jgi:diguanylate cyclase (GGDEF)-like protein